MRCSKCGVENREGRKFCAECSAPLAVNCPRCGAPNEPGEKFCGECSAPLGAPAAAGSAKKAESPIHLADATASENVEGERKTVTALFADIKGSTELEQDLDPEEARAIVDPALKLMIDAVHRYDGYVVQSTGDGIFAIFGAPVAHEDHPQRALYAALRMRDELRKYSSKLREAGTSPLEARIGANTGEVVVRSIATGRGEPEYTPIGHTANLASRMQTLAPTGSIAISEATRKLVEGYLTLKPLGPTKVKGVNEPVNVYEVMDLGPLRTHFQLSARRGLTRFVGRNTEMDALAHAADLAKSGHGQIVGVVAEPGVGKSRLFHEFKLRNQSGWMVLEAISESHGKASPYSPVIELLQSYFRIAREDDTRTRREKLTGRVIALDRALEDTLPYVLGLMGLLEGADPLAQMDPQIRRRRTHEALKRIFLREAQNQPLMVVFEDLHWIDDETQALLDVIAEVITNAPVILMLNYRPEYKHDWSNQASYTQLRLEPLRPDNAEEMLSMLLGDAVEVAPLKRLIIQRTEGTPFFIEETIQALFEDGTLIRNGQVKVTRSLSQLSIPATVNAMLASRIDRLSPDEKQLLQTLAVIGTEFSLKLASSVVDQSEEHLIPMLDQLQQREFIFERLVGGDIEYSFKHALTHDVAYNSILSDRRKALHARIAETIETRWRGHLDDYTPALARHYSRSGNNLKAVEYLTLAAQRAQKRFAHDEVLELTRSALERLPELPIGEPRERCELNLQQLTSSAITGVKGYGASEAATSLERWRELAKKVGNRNEKLYAALDAYRYYLGRRDFQRMRELLAEMAQFSESQSNLRSDIACEEQSQIDGVYAYWAFLDGNFSEARRRYERSLESYPPNRRRQWRFDRYFLSVALFNLGYPDQALTQANNLAREVESIGVPDGIVAASLCHGSLLMERGELVEALKHAEIASERAAEYGLRHPARTALLLRGECFYRLGNIVEGIAEIRRALNAIRLDDRPSIDDYFPQYRRATILAAGDDTNEALDRISAALEAIGSVSGREDESQLYRVKGELLLKQGSSHAAEGEQCLRTAIDVAQRQTAKMYELRATVSLARLLRDTNRCDEARTMLAEIYGWFTEGFDTADLKDAKALLEELS